MNQILCSVVLSQLRIIGVHKFYYKDLLQFVKEKI